jgi:hypothetical protein
VVARRPWLLAGGIVLAPLAVLAVVVLVEGARAPAGDVALIELRVRDVGTSRTPLLGSYSRFGYNQPGPALLWVLAVPYRLLGARYAGLEVGALLLTALSLAAVLWVAWRRAGALGTGGAALVLALWVRGVGPGWLVDPWEPHVLAPVALAVLVLAADVVAGRRAWSLPLVAAGASFIAQSWGTMLAFAVVLGGWSAVAVLVAAWRRPDERRVAVRSLLVSAAVVLVLWAPALVEQARSSPGNLVAMWRALGEPSETLGATDAWRAVAVELGPRPTWLGFPQSLEVFAATVDLDGAPVVPAGGLLLAAALVVAVARRWRGPALFATTVVLGVAAAWWSMDRLIPPLFLWIPQWLGVLGAGAALAVGAVAARAVVDRVGDRPVLPLGLLALAAVASGWACVDAVGDWRRPDPLRDAVAEVAGAAALDGDDGPVLARSRLDVRQVLGDQDVALEVLVAALERRGLEVVVERDAANRFGPERARPERAGAELRLVAATPDEPPPDGFEVVATADPLQPAERAGRERVLARAGLPPDAPTRDVLLAAAADRSLAAELRRYPDLPVVVLLRGPAGAS